MLNMTRKRAWLYRKLLRGNQTWFANSEPTGESEKATIKGRQAKILSICAAVLVQLRNHIAGFYFHWHCRKSITY